MTGHRETFAFGAVLAVAVTGFLGASLVGGKVLSPGDVVFVQATFAEGQNTPYEPVNRLLMDPVLQFEPWLEYSRDEIRAGRLPLWNPRVGCGAPHLANGQSAVFDPFHGIAYLGTLPEALAWMAAARLWMAGMGMFLLARGWGLGGWGRWFSGLVFPFGGFLVVWLLYPPASVAVWMPWHLQATDRALREPRPATVGWLAIVTALVLLGGHVQTSAHVLMASAGWVAWQVVHRGAPRPPSWGVRASLLGVGLGLLTGSVAILPLGTYLARSPVWADRQGEHASPWEVGQPRLLETICTGLPYIYGSQRRGHPHLARPLGVDNLNESAGGFAGLATLVWLAPLGFFLRRRDPRIGFLGVLVLVGALGAFGIPPLANALRLVPVLDVMDHRRLTLWILLGLSLLGGVGLDQIATTTGSRAWRRWGVALAAGALAMLVAAVVVVGVGPRLRDRAVAHYDQAADLDSKARIVLADRQVRNLTRFLPAYNAVSALHLIALAMLIGAMSRGRLGPTTARSLVMGLTLADLAAFGVGLNPAIERDQARPSSRVIDRLREIAPPPSRIVGVGSELAPNTLMRYGLNDCRNYDSIELTRSLDWFEPLYEPEPGRGARSSRREITWSGVVRARDRLQVAGVVAAVGATPPPSGEFARVEQIGGVWIAMIPGAEPLRVSVRGNEITIDVRGVCDDRRMFPVTYDPAWRAELDGKPVGVRPSREAWLSVSIPRGSRRLVLRYDPPEVRVAVGLSATGLCVSLAFLLLDRDPGRGSTGRKTGTRAWMGSSPQVKIESTSSCWSPNRLSTEGRDADGPLHV